MLLKYNNQEYSVEADLKDSRLEATINGESLQAYAVEIGSNTAVGKQFQIHSNGMRQNYFAVEDETNIYVTADGVCFTFAKIDEDSKNFGFGATKSDTMETIFAPMPGSIVKVFVAEGDVVEEGSPLIIVEAMKMETTLYASISGNVRKVSAVAGEQVSPDKELIVVSKE
jgi:biotin carboxyl carrier protein